MKKKLRILSIFGTRPEAVKMAPVIEELRKNKSIDSIVCVTAQHREMLDQVLDLFEIKPDIDLNLMRPNQNLSRLTADLIAHIDPVLEKVNPDWILIQGDTTTVMAASLTAFYRRITIGHVEAGLRTGNRWQPFPEEINRRIAGVTANLHFAPTEHARQNLLKEGVPDWRIAVTGNPVIDALHVISGQPAPAKIKELLKRLQIHPGGKELILVTAHRRENFGKPIEDICRSLQDLAKKYSQRVEIIYPVHLNPNIQEPVNRLLKGIKNITLLKPQEYLSLVHLLRSSKLVLTDSGGIQEEATGLGKPALVLRQVTERPEGVEAGVLKVVGTDRKRIVSEASRLLDDPKAWESMAHAANPYGDGHAARKIIQAILHFNEKAHQ